MHRSGVAAGLCALFEVPFPFSPPSPPPSYLLGSSADCAAEPDPFLPFFLSAHYLTPAAIIETLLHSMGMAEPGYISPWPDRSA